jgi:hypothetical protein
MKRWVQRETRQFRVTAANLREGHLYITGNPDFFPADCYGPPSRKAGTGKPLRLDIDGLDRPVMTDIPTEARSGKPRRFFRNRRWFRPFSLLFGIKPGDFVTIERVSKRGYAIHPPAGRLRREYQTTFAF